MWRYQLIPVCESTCATDKVASSLHVFARRSNLNLYPFCNRNGLREKPTLMLNMMTQWANFVIYFELPDWVKNMTEALVESEDDTNEVKALKRFFNGDDKYRKPRLKVLPALVEAPYAVQLLAPKKLVESPAYQEGLVETIYYEHDVAGEQCPVFEVSLDFVESKTVRSMASMVKRYLHSISIDMALNKDNARGASCCTPPYPISASRLL